MWSFGVILYILLSGCFPFSGYDKNIIFEKIRKGQYKLHAKLWENVSIPAKDLIRGLLTLNPEKRLTVDQALAHPWIQQTGAELKSKILTVRGLRGFQSRQRFRKIVNTVIAFRKFCRIVGVKNNERNGEQPSLFGEETHQSSVFMQTSVAGSGQLALALPSIGKYRYFTSDVVKVDENKTFLIYRGFHSETKAEVLLLIYDCSVMTEKQVDAARYEYQLVNTHLQHPNIVRYDEIIEDPVKRKICIVMEYLYGEELYQRLEQRLYYSEKEAKQLAHKMLQTIKCMHDKGIIHR
jgi:serine/threonine protein kinase